MKLRRSTVIPSILLIYLGVMSYIGYSEFQQGNYLYYLRCYRRHIAHNCHPACFSEKTGAPAGERFTPDVEINTVSTKHANQNPKRNH